MRDNDIDIESDELSEDFGRALAAPFPPAIENGHVATFDPAELAQPLDESIGPLPLNRSRSRIRAEKSDRGQGCRLLRARGERPRGCTAEQGDERAAIHSITSSARASSVGGMVRPSALAALRLITSSNRVGCSSRMSAGRAPLRIRSTWPTACRN